MRARALVIAGAIGSALVLTTSGTAAADAATDIAGDGVYLVNTELRPGTYVADGAADPAVACFWRRLWKVQTPSDYADPNYYVIASDFTRSRPIRVVIKATDVAFKTENCGGWHLVPDAPSTGSGGS